MARFWGNDGRHVVQSLAICVTLLAPAVAHGVVDVGVSVSPPSATLNSIGATTTTNLDADNGSGVTSIQFTVQYDNTVVRATAATSGSCSSLFVATNGVCQGGGRTREPVRH